MDDPTIEAARHSALREPGPLLELLIPPCDPSALPSDSARECCWPARLIAQIARAAGGDMAASLPTDDGLPRTLEHRWRWEQAVTRPVETFEVDAQGDAGGGGGLMIETAIATVTATPREGRLPDTLDAALIMALMSLTRRTFNSTRDPVLRIVDADAVWEQVEHDADALEGTTILPVPDPSRRSEHLAAALRRLAAVEIDTDTAIRHLGAGGDDGCERARRRVCLRVVDTWAVCGDEVALRWSREAYAALMHHADTAATGRVDDAKA